MLLYTLKSLLIVVTSLTASPESDSLLEKFKVVCTSIENQRGFVDGDKATVRNLLAEIEELNATNEDFKLIVAALQMNLWLQNNERCDVLFERIAELRPDDSGIAIAWAQFLLAQDGADEASVYAEIITKFPNSPEVVNIWANSLEAKNQFTKAIEALETLNDEALSTPEIAEMYARVLYADNRFEDSIAALDAVDPSILVSNTALSARISRQKSESQSALTKWNEELAIQKVEQIADDLPLVVMQTSKGIIKLELYEDQAPNTVANFISLADSGYYDGIRFHRVLPKFMAQGGDPNSRDGAEGNPGEGGPGYTIEDEHNTPDKRNHFAGTLSMAKTSAPNTGGSQFFLTHLPTPHLDGRHTVFGRITDGLDNARNIEQNDEIISVMIIRKRDHEYTPIKVGESQVEEDKPRLKPTLNSDME